MMRLSRVALVLTATAVQAESGPPTAEEVAKARAECLAVVQQACLYTLALDSLLSTLPADLTSDDAALWLNGLARRQITAGDQEGALRTLGLTKVEPNTLLLLGLWDEAWASAEASFVGREPEMFTTHEGNFKRQMVDAMLT